MIPSPSDLQYLDKKIMAVRALADGNFVAPEHDDFRRVVVLLGSSRSGSSLLFHLLARTGRFWAPQGEETPFYRLAGLGWIRVKENSDLLAPPVDEAVRGRAYDYLIHDIGRESSGVALEADGHVAQVATRLLVQWPHLDLDPADLVAAVREAAENAVDDNTLWLRLLDRFGLESGLYDLPGPKSRNLRFEIPSYFFEEPPFVIQTARERPTSLTAGQRPLLLKTSTNAYRLNWLKTLFPRAEFRYVVLTRNPAASINGLMDGWTSHAFHSHNLEFVTPLKIRNYSESSPLGDRWWKFDLPPGWAEFDDAPLAEVCAFQWRSAYEAILNAVAGAHLQVQFERLLAPQTGGDVLARVLEYCGVENTGFVAPTAVRPVMASEPPATARWRRRAEEIEPLLTNPRIIQLAERMGYDLRDPGALP